MSPSRAGFQKLKRKTLRALFRYDPSYTDMFTDSSELYFAKLYFHQIQPYLEQLQPVAKILDAGCQAGRFTVALAKMEFQVTGIDTSGFSLDRAKKHCAEQGVKADFIKGEIGRLCGQLPENSFDAVVCTEVLYLHPQFESMMRSMLRVLKPDGFLITSHRTKFYYLSKALARKDFQTARLIIETNEGPLWGTYFNWQTLEELRTLHQKVGARTKGIHPIGIFSEILLSPGELEPSLQDELFDIEKEPFDEVTGCTRYLLAIGEKTADPDSHLS